jgi:hypothetical protein
MSMMKASIWIDFFIGSVIGSLKIALMFCIVLSSALIGLTIGTMTLYGEKNL